MWVPNIPFGNHFLEVISLLLFQEVISLPGGDITSVGSDITSYKSRVLTNVKKPHRNFANHMAKLFTT